MASDSCAVGPNSTLLEASQIVWFNDPDNDEPIVPATSSVLSAAQPQVSMVTLDSFVTKIPPATCQSGHAPHLSIKAIDPNNIIAHK